MNSVLPDYIPLLIGGSHRSGTTLLRRVINGHKHFFCPPEVKFHKDLLGQHLDDPLAFARLGATITVLGLPQEWWLDEFGRAYVRCMELATGKAGKRRWADKNPENSINIRHWDRLLEGKLRFVLTVRNPLDILASVSEMGLQRTIGNSLGERVDHIRKYIEQGLDYCDKFPDRSMIVQYEHMVRQPNVVFEKLFFWLNEEWDAAILDDINGPHQGRGLEDPKVDLHAAVTDANVNRWHRDLTAEDAVFAINQFANIMKRFSYSDNMSEF